MRVSDRTPHCRHLPAGAQETGSRADALSVSSPFSGRFFGQLPECADAQDGDSVATMSVVPYTSGQLYLDELPPFLRARFWGRRLSCPKGRARQQEPREQLESEKSQIFVWCPVRVSRLLRRSTPNAFARPLGHEKNPTEDEGGGRLVWRVRWVEWGRVGVWEGWEEGKREGWWWWFGHVIGNMVLQAARRITSSSGNCPTHGTAPRNRPSSNVH